MITVLLTGDMKTLYMRGIRRDDHDKRHPGHLLNRYHRGQPVSKEDWIQIMPFDEYVRMCREKDYDIRLGRTLTVDVTDIDAVDTKKICDEIETAALGRRFRTVELKIFKHYTINSKEI